MPILASFLHPVPHATHVSDRSMHILFKERIPSFPMASNLIPTRGGWLERTFVLVMLGCNAWNTSAWLDGKCACMDRLQPSTPLPPKPGAPEPIDSSRP